MVKSWIRINLNYASSTRVIFSPDLTCSSEESQNPRTLYCKVEHLSTKPQWPTVNIFFNIFPSFHEKKICLVIKPILKNFSHSKTAEYKLIPSTNTLKLDFFLERIIKIPVLSESMNPWTVQTIQSMILLISWQELVIRSDRGEIFWLDSSAAS